jgi:hypothetical protein
MCSYLNVEPSHARLEIGAIWYSPEVVRDWSTLSFFLSSSASLFLFYI